MQILQPTDQIIEALADLDMSLPLLLRFTLILQIQPVGSIDQSGIITSQSVVSFRAVPAAGAATATDPCAACKDATSRRWLGLRGSSVQADIAKATDTWWPGDKAKVQKATCSAS